MKKLNRQTLLIGGAVACLFIALIALFSGSAGKPSPASVPSDAVKDAAPAEMPTDPGGTSPDAPSMNPEFYQRVRQQLLAVTPEHQEPFVAQDRVAPPVPSPDTTARPLPGNRSLPVLPIAFQPSASVPISSPGGSPSNGVAIPSDASNLGSAGTSPSSVASAGMPTNNPTPRVRGQIRDHASGKIVVLFELNGALIRASNEPNAEWRVVRIEPRQITVRNGKQTLLLEVPYAP